eukprot:COSAG01_NODE_66423_length_270_cov_0.608187_1_plen_44_part_10
MRHPRHRPAPPLTPAAEIAAITITIALAAAASASGGAERRRAFA